MLAACADAVDRPSAVLVEMFPAAGPPPRLDVKAGAYVTTAGRAGAGVYPELPDEVPIVIGITAYDA